MTVKFRLAELDIREFRGMDKFTLQLPRGVPAYLVGANNAGKTTVLEALALSLRGGGFHSFAPGAFDYRYEPGRGHAEEFHVRLTFEPDGGKLPAVKGIEAPSFVHGVHVRGRTTRRGFEHSHYLTNDQGETITFSPATPVAAALKAEFAGTGAGYRRVNARLDDIRDFLPEVWMLRPQDVEASLYTWRTGPLRRLAKLLSEHLLTDKWTFRGREMPAALVSAHGFLREAVQELPFWKEDLKPKLEEALGRYIGGPTQFSLSPDPAALEEWLIDQLTIAFAVGEGAAPVPLQHMGDGWQSLVRLAALDVFRQYPDLIRGEGALLLLEEPETHLHPHLRRKLRDILEDLAANGWQIVVSTHAPEFVSFVGGQQLTRLSREGAGVTAYTPAAGDIRDEIKRQERLEMGRATMELPFSRYAVISEGKSDELAFRLAFKAIGFDPEAASLSILRSDGAPGLPATAKLAAALGIPWFAVTDEDTKPDGTANPVTERARQALSAMRTERDGLAVMPGKLESALKLASHADSAEVFSLLSSKTESQLRSEYPQFVAVADQIRVWCGGNLRRKG
jgi:hypothetical protein